MNTTTRRLYAVALIVLLTYGVNRLVKAETEGAGGGHALVDIPGVSPTTR